MDWINAKLQRYMKTSIANLHGFPISNDAAICYSLTLAHGVIRYSPYTTPRLEGTVATHSCGEGYGLSPSVRTRTCQPDKTWSGENVACQRNYLVYHAQVQFHLNTCSYHVSTSHSSPWLGSLLISWTTLSVSFTNRICDDILS